MTAVATIIVPLKRQKDEWLDQCVRSALTQAARSEVIVVRSEATPASNLRILEKLQAEFDNLRVLVEEKPGSFPGAINLGIRRATTSRIGFLLSDDWLDRDAVAHGLPLAADIVCTGVSVYLEDGVTLHRSASQTLTMAKYRALDSLEARASYLQHFFLFQRAALMRVGGLDETIGNFPGIDDYDLIWTLLEQGATVEIVEKRLYNYRDHHGERLTLADPAEATRNLEKILRKHRVPEAQLAQLIQGQSRWFGRTMQSVLAEDGRG